MIVALQKEDGGIRVLPSENITQKLDKALACIEIVKQNYNIPLEATDILQEVTTLINDTKELNLEVAEVLYRNKLEKEAEKLREPVNYPF